MIVKPLSAPTRHGLAMQAQCPQPHNLMHPASHLCAQPSHALHASEQCDRALRHLKACQGGISRLARVATQQRGQTARRQLAAVHQDLLATSAWQSSDRSASLLCSRLLLPSGMYQVAAGLQAVLPQPPVCGAVTTSHHSCIVMSLQR
jgi:hypothetical protein